MDRYSRQMILPEIGSKGQKKLLNSKILIVGCGALGCHSSNILARAGVGSITLIDRDFVELNNLQRQILFTEKHLGEPKAWIAKQVLKKINSEIEIEGTVEDLNSRNVLSFVKDKDLILDGTDNMQTRYLINDACVELRKPWIYAGAVSTYAMTFNILPGKACFKCLFPKVPKASSLETCESVGILNTVPQIISGFQVSQALKYLLGKKIFSELLITDSWLNTFERIKVEKNKACKCCVKREFEFLKGFRRERVATLCGQNSVQINPLDAEIDLETLSKKLERLGKVELRKFMLTFDIGEYQLNIFKTGRCIVRGTGDLKVAKSLYSKYVGN
ncbi:MAG: ThiF family adenylyltransferase [Candidatus Methanofastidiosia archaeon]